MGTTFDQIRASYPRAKRDWIRLHCPYSHLLQPLSMRVAAVAVRLGMAANTVTGLAWLVLLAALGLIAAGGGHRSTLALGAALLSVMTVLDNVDGHVARCTATTSRAGEMLDDALTWFHLSALPIALGVALHLDPPRLPGSWSWAESVPLLWLTLAAARSIAYLLIVVLGRKAEQTLGPYESRPGGLVLFGAAKGVAEYEAVLLVIAVLIDALWLHHLFYALFYLAALSAVAAKTLADAVRMDRAPLVEHQAAHSLPLSDGSR